MRGLPETPSIGSTQAASATVEGCKRSPNTHLPKEMGAAAGVARLLLFFAIFGGLVWLVDLGIDAGLRRIPTSDIGALNYALSGHVQAEVVISGSSRALVHYDPGVIQAATGLPGFNLGRNGSHVDMHAAVLEAYLAKNKKPKLVVYNLDLHAFETTEELYDPAPYLPHLADPHIYRAVRSINPSSWRWKYLPLYGYAVEDMRFTWLVGLKGLLGLYPVEDHFSGFNPRDLEWTGDFEAFKTSHQQGYRVKVEQAGVEYLRKIIRMCKDRGVRMVLVYSPEYLEAQEMALNRGEVFSMFKAEAAAAGVPFIDFSSSSICKDRALFYNSQHLNRRGAEAFSRELGTELQAILSNGQK